MRFPIHIDSRFNTIYFDLSHFHSVDPHSLQSKLHSFQQVWPDLLVLLRIAHFPLRLRLHYLARFPSQSSDMKLSISIQVALMATPILVSAAGTLGFALGTKRPDGSCKYQADYEADYDALNSAAGSSIVRGYSASDCNFAEYALPAAKNKGVQVILGVWLVWGPL